MKTVNSKHTKLVVKALAAALAMGLTVSSPLTAMPVHAELVDETDDWNREGEQHNEDITPTEQEQHDQDNANNLENGGETPAPQDAEAVVDNSNGGQEPSNQPNPPSGTGSDGNSDPTKGEVTDWEHYDPTTDPTWDHQDPKLPDNLPDEVDRKTPDKPDTPDTPDKPDKPDTPGTPDKPTPPPTTTIVKTGDSAAPYAAVGVVLGGSLAGFYLVVDSKRKYRLMKQNIKTLTRTK